MIRCLSQWQSCKRLIALFACLGMSSVCFATDTIGKDDIDLSKLTASLEAQLQAVLPPSVQQSAENVTTPSNEQPVQLALNDESQTAPVVSQNDNAKTANAAVDANKQTATEIEQQAETIKNIAPEKDAKTAAMPAPDVVTATVKQASSDGEVNPSTIIDLAKKVSISAFTYRFDNTGEYLDKTEKLFTQEGWKEFEKALYASKNLDIVKQEKLSVTAMLDGQAALVKQEAVTGGGKLWRVIVPIKVTYASESHQVKQRLEINLGIVSVSSKENDAGFAVTQFVAKVA